MVRVEGYIRTRDAKFTRQGTGEVVEYTEYYLETKEGDEPFSLRKVKPREGARAVISREGGKLGNGRLILEKLG